jgi:uncharacterized membrane protein HdeD (DUF308 family)
MAGTGQSPRPWGWFLALGVALVVLGLLCIMGATTATLVAELTLGWLLITTAVLALVQAYRTRHQRGFFLYLLAAILRGVTGFLLLRYPVAGELSLTLLVAAALIVGGIFRGVGAARLRFPQWGWGVASGAISVILGVVVTLALPAAGFWFLGLALGVDLVFEGVALVALSAALRGVPPFPEPSRV